MNSVDRKKFHLVDWKNVCSLIMNGGLGIRNIRMHKKVLLGRWLWNFGMDREFVKTSGCG